MRLATRRARIAGALLLLPFLALAGRATHLSVVDGRGAARAVAQSERVITLAAERGAIVDRSGDALALTLSAPSVYAVPSELEDPERAARQLARALGLDASRLTARLRGRRKFLFLARWVAPARAERVAALGLVGVGILREPRRTYPHGKLAGQLIGFANIDGVGVRGAEQQEDAWLRGTARRVPVERDARGHLLVVGGEDRWITTGGDIALTIDSALQADAQLALREAIAASGARGGVVVSMDPATGDILTLAESPELDPNSFRKLDYTSTRSRAFLDASDPGSTLKAFLIAAALERKAIAIDQNFDCENGELALPGKTIRDHRPHGELNVGEILRLSSNIGAVKIAQALGPSAHFEMLRRFGFGAPTGSGFPDESAGVLRPWQDWTPIDHATIAFGQGVTVTPVQLAAAAAAFANGGMRVQPRLVAARRAARGAWIPVPRGPAQRAISEETAAAVLAMLEAAAGPSGTGRAAALRGVRVAGKTGTAQKLDPGSGRYATDRFSAWFIGVVPVDDPRLVIVTGLDEPRRPLHTGGAVAAPLFARVASAQLARFGIFTEPERVAARERSRPDARSAAATGRRADRVLVPDLRGLTAAEVAQVAARSGFAVEASGRGRVVAQEPAPGTVLAIGATRVRVRFSPPAGDAAARGGHATHAASRGAERPGRGKG
ncbi:MAG: penicillin-binding protein [Myxococcota bacterium]